MKNSERFFKNTDCKHFPCHSTPQEENFNCLFCFCPLYRINDCGGNFSRNKKGVKVCMDCHLPHMPEYYDEIIKKLSKEIF